MNKVVIGDATLYQGDCMAYMATLPDKAFALAICDPPYGIHDKLLRKGNTGALWERKLATYQHTQWDTAIPTDEYFSELMRVSENQVIWGGNYFDLPPTRGIICWDKVQPWPNFSAWEMAWTSFNSVARLFKYDNRTGDKIHPTQKPEALYLWLLNNYAKPGQRILDTHGGSMSSVIAALNLGFEITCCELDADYFSAGVDRVRAAQRQQPMFTPEPVKQIQESFL